MKNTLRRRKGRAFPHIRRQNHMNEAKYIIEVFSIDKSPKNSYYSQPDASADRDDDRARTTRPSLLFLCLLAMNRCDRRPNPLRRLAPLGPGQGKSSRDTETFGPRVDKRKADHLLALRADRA